jgi:hypothetical protein
MLALGTSYSLECLIDRLAFNKENKRVFIPIAVFIIYDLNLLLSLAIYLLQCLTAGDFVDFNTTRRLDTYFMHKVK